jgi:hypothetical protein
MAKEQLPSIHLYPGDWLRDAISGCSLEAQGLWLRMMFIMHDSDRYGHLSKDGVSISPGLVARRCGSTLEQYTSLLKELTDAGVPSLTENGIIYSRRMVRDADQREYIRKIRSLAGSKGGRPPLKKSKRKAKTKQTHEDEDDIEDMFLRLWSFYPRKLGKEDALKHFREAIENGTTFDRVKKALDNYLAEIKSDRREDKYILHGSTWFNKRWSDYENWKPAGSVSVPIESTAARHTRLLSEGRCDTCTGGKIEKDEERGDYACTSCGSRWEKEKIEINLKPVVAE